MCCFAAVAEDFGDGARVCVSLHVGFAGAVVGAFTRRFTSDSKCIGEVARAGGSAESVAVELAFGGSRWRAVGVGLGRE